MRIGDILLPSSLTQCLARFSSSRVVGLSASVPCQIWLPIGHLARFVVDVLVIMMLIEAGMIIVKKPKPEKEKEKIPSHGRVC